MFEKVRRCILHHQKRGYLKPLFLFCTGGENRTPAKGFGDPRSTTKLPPPTFASRRTPAGRPATHSSRLRIYLAIAQLRQARPAEMSDGGVHSGKNNKRDAQRQPAKNIILLPCAMCAPCISDNVFSFPIFPSVFSCF